MDKTFLIIQKILKDSEFKKRLIKTNVENKKYSSSAIHAAIFKDLIKGPDIFLLIILSRNLILIENNNEISERIKYFKKNLMCIKRPDIVIVMEYY